MHTLVSTETSESGSTESELEHGGGIEKLNWGDFGDFSWGDNPDSGFGLNEEKRGDRDRFALEYRSGGEGIVGVLRSPEQISKFPIRGQERFAGRGVEQVGRNDRSKGEHEEDTNSCKDVCWK